MHLYITFLTENEMMHHHLEKSSKNNNNLLLVAALFAVATLITLSLVVTVSQQAAFADPQPTNPKKVTICHIPPGNPAERHTITVGAPAVAAHVRNHGDEIGACQPPIPEP